jgi:hypothetical protein
LRQQAFDKFAVETSINSVASAEYRHVPACATVWNDPLSVCLSQVLRFSVVEKKTISSKKIIEKIYIRRH